MSEPQIAARGAAVEITDRGGTFLIANCPAQFGDGSVGAKPWIADLGQHTVEILEEIGLDAD